MRGIKCLMQKNMSEAFSASRLVKIILLGHEDVKARIHPKLLILILDKK